MSESMTNDSSPPKIYGPATNLSLIIEHIPFIDYILDILGPFLQAQGQRKLCRWQ